YRTQILGAGNRPFLELAVPAAGARSRRDRTTHRLYPAGADLGLSDIQLLHAARSALLRAMTLTGILSQLLQVVVAVLLAPLLLGWVNQCRAWLANKRAPSIVLPYHTIRKLFTKDAVVAEQASPIFRLAPYV